MTGTALVTEIVGILVSGITGIAQGIGAGLSDLAQAIFFTTTGETQSLSVMGILIICFAGIALAIGLSRWVLNFLTSMGARNR